MGAGRAWLAAGIAVAAVTAVAVLARQRARHNRELARQGELLIECVEKINDYGTALEIIGRGMTGPPRTRLSVVSAG